MVQRWRRRWLATQTIADILVRLADAPRPGAPATYTPEQVCAIVALACERPVVVEAIVDPNVPPLPPHITVKQARDYLKALAKGDPDRRSVLRASIREMMA